MGKPCPGGTAPALRPRNSTATLCAAPQPRLLSSSHRRHDRSARARASPSYPPRRPTFFAVCVCSALEGEIRGREPLASDVEFSVRNPENVTVEREERRTSAVSASVQKAREEKEESPEVRNGNTEQCINGQRIRCTVALFYLFLFYSIPLNLIAVS